MKEINQKDVVEKLLDKKRIELAVKEIYERYWQRKRISGEKRMEPVLADTQAEIREMKSFIKFLEEICKE